MPDNGGTSSPGTGKPRILLLCDRRAWAFDRTARSLSSHLSSEFDVDVLYVSEEPVIVPDAYDLVVVFFWGERYHRKFVPERSKIAKVISSHRWQVDARFGKHSPEEAVDRYMHDAGHLLTTSVRLFEAFRDRHPHVYHCPNGVDTALFRMDRERNGAVRFGWAGNSRDAGKGLHDILMPACDGRFEMHVADGGFPFEEMGDFYNSLDVYCIASDAEGEPLTLIEAMACGCFPVCTDVGIVPELVDGGRNGLIVERTPEAFRQAFEWCREHPEHVRDAGRANAELIRERRSWNAVGSRYAAAIRSILSFRKEFPPGDVNEIRTERDAGYEKHFERINPGGSAESAYGSACRYYLEDVEPLLPDRRDARILEIGTGHGHLLRYLVDKGYMRVTGIDLCESLMQGVRVRLAHRVERLEVADAADFLPRREGKYDCIVMLDLIEHMTEEKASEVLASARVALAPGGRLILRTPNMANVLGIYSLHMDLTHRRGYTEWSLRQLLERCGFPSNAIGLHIPTAFATSKRRCYAGINEAAHRALYRLNDRVPAKWFGKNIVVWADRGGF